MQEALFTNTINQINKYKLALLLIFPCVYIFLSNYFRSIFGSYFLHSVDPEYIYFISGLSIANLRLDIGHIDNPGSPLQFFIALVFRITHLIRSPKLPFVEDALTNSDLYIGTANFAINLIIFLFLIFIGFFIHRLTTSITLSLLVQTTPFITDITYDNMGRIAPEMWMPIPCLLLTGIIIAQILRGKDFDSLKTIFILAFISGFGLSLKLTYLPLFIFPILIIPGAKKKFLGLVISIFSFLIIALPVTLNISTFWIWIRNLVTHSGNYGNGEKNFIDLSSFVSSIKALISTNSTFFIVLSSLILILVIQIINKKWKNEKIVLRISFALILTIILQLILTAKHFEFRYFIPSLLLFPLIIYIIIQILYRTYKKRYIIRSFQIIIPLFLLIGTINQIHIIQTKTIAFSNNEKKRLAFYNEVQCLEEESIKIIVPYYYGSPTHEYSMVFAEAWAGKPAELYKPILKKMYPTSYLYYRWENKFRYWGDKPDLEKAFNNKTPVYIIFSDYDANMLEDILIKTKELAEFNGELKASKTFYSDSTNERIFRVTEYEK